MRGNITRIRRGSSTLPLECADTRYVISLMSADPMQSGRQRQEQNEVLDLYMACAGRGSYQRRGSTQG